MIQVLRREEKYPISYREARMYSNTFASIMMTDKFSKEGSYSVRSLYFDTPDDKDFFEKMTEQNLRRKVRLRIYNPSDKTAKLELKQKENVFQKSSDTPTRISTPEIRGVIVVCDGGDNILIREKVISAVSGAFGISTTRVSVIK